METEEVMIDLKETPVETEEVMIDLKETPVETEEVMIDLKEIPIIIRIEIILLKQREIIGQREKVPQGHVTGVRNQILDLNHSISSINFNFSKRFAALYCIDLNAIFVSPPSNGSLMVGCPPLKRPITVV